MARPYFAEMLTAKQPHKKFSPTTPKNFTLHHRLLKGGPTGEIIAFVATQHHLLSLIHLLLRVSLLIFLFMRLPHNEMFVRRLLIANIATKNLLSIIGQVSVAAIQRFLLHQRPGLGADLGCVQVLKLKSVTIVDLL